MDFRKIKTDNTTVTRNMQNFSDLTGNVYETVAMLSKRSNQIAAEMKHELLQKIEEYANVTDNLEEVFENREQIEIVKYYEQLPKPTLIAIKEYLNEELEYRNPEKEAAVVVEEEA